MRFRYPPGYFPKNTGRPPQNEMTVPFVQQMPLNLRDKVSGKGDKGGQVSCLQEMTVLFACFKANDFDQVVCGKEISSFQDCWVDHKKKMKEKEEREKKGLLSPGAKKLTHKQVTAMLQKFPNK